VLFRSALVAEQMKRDKVLEIAELVYGFAGAVAALGGIASLGSVVLNKPAPASNKLNIRPLARTYKPAQILGTPDAGNDALAAARESKSAKTYSSRPDVKEVYLGQRAKGAFKSPKDEKFPDVVAKMNDGSYGLGEGKGTDMKKVVQQFESAGKRLGGKISAQH